MSRVTNPGTLLRARVARLADQVAPMVRSLRWQIHRRPELRFLERRTAGVVVEVLRKLGIAHRAGVGPTGVIATLRGRRGGRVVALRAEMDALPIEEESGVHYASRNRGVMHACGHDGNVAILLGTAHILSSLRDRWSGTIRLVFQPGEEGGGGARILCKDGALDRPRVERIYALHGWPPLPCGTIGWRRGPMLAASDDFEILVEGRGAHGSSPHLGVDPILVAARIVEALQTIVSREASATDALVITVGEIKAGTAPNIIPDRAFLRGTIRTLRPAVRAKAVARVRQIARGIALSHRARAKVDIHPGYPVTVNEEESVERICRVTDALLGPGSSRELEAPSMGSEDFSYYLKEVPGAMFRLGLSARGKTSWPPLHSSHFRFNDNAIPVGLRMMAGVALDHLTEGDFLTASDQGQRKKRP